MLIPTLWRPLPQPWVGRQDVPWLVLVSCWAVSCVLLLCMAPPVLAKPKEKAAPVRRSVLAAHKGAVATELSYEKRLQIALGLMHQKQWQQAVQTIGHLDEISVVT